MNFFTELSIDYANQRNYLDELFKVYPTIPEGIRDIDQSVWEEIVTSYNNQNKIELIKLLLKRDIFPIKDSYIAFLKRDEKAIERNPSTINRIFGRLCELGLEGIFERCTQPKETNRQIGPMFRNWLNRGVLGVPIIKRDEFLSFNGNAVLDAGDIEMMNFAKQHLNYNRDKGLDFIAKFNGKYVVGEAKFLTDFGGHQNSQFNDAISTLQLTGVNAIKVAILDGVLYIKGKNKMYKDVVNNYFNENIMSTLVLREFLFQI